MSLGLLGSSSPIPPFPFSPPPSSTFTGVVPYAGTNIASYEYLKSQYLDYLNSHLLEDPSRAAQFGAFAPVICGAFSPLPHSDHLPRSSSFRNDSECLGSVRLLPSLRLADANASGLAHLEVFLFALHRSELGGRVINACISIRETNLEEGGSAGLLQGSPPQHAQGSPVLGHLLFYLRTCQGLLCAVSSDNVSQLVTRDMFSNVTSNNIL